MSVKPIHYNAALYMRLSKDDDGAKESVSITTQKKMLMAYAKENSYTIYDTYIDDGFSGTNFDRPNFKRMIQDIEMNKVNLVITKDLSRLGRDYIQTGQFTEVFFPIHGVRYIAINDGYDSDSPYNDIAPFKNIMNEMYARDISKKIKSAFVTKMQEGSYIGNFAPYGYQKDPENKNHLIIDRESSKVVLIIFEMAAKGYKPKQIANCLNKENILTPALYRCKNKPYLNIDNYSKRKEWTSATISKILHNEIYLGHTVQGKTNKISLKSSKSIPRPKEEWISIYNTHDPIVSNEIFHNATWQLSSRKVDSVGRFQNIFLGIGKCMDCQRNMSTTISRKKGATANLVCGGYKLYGSSTCSNHFIDYDTLLYIIKTELKKQLYLSDEEKDSLYQEISYEINKQSKNEIQQSEKQLESLQSKSSELDYMIKRLYEDNATGKIGDERFHKLYQTYELEQREIEKELANIQSKIDNTSYDKKDKKLSVKDNQIDNQMDRILNLDILTNQLLHCCIQRIEIGQGEYKQTQTGRKKIQKIKVYYNF